MRAENDSFVSISSVRGCVGAGQKQTLLTV